LSTLVDHGVTTVFVSLYESTLALLSNQAAAWFLSGKQAGCMGTRPSGK